MIYFFFGFVYTFFVFWVEVFLDLNNKNDKKIKTEENLIEENFEELDSELESALNSSEPANGKPALRRQDDPNNPDNQTVIIQKYDKDSKKKKASKEIISFNPSFKTGLTSDQVKIRSNICSCT